MIRNFGIFLALCNLAEPAFAEQDLLSGIYVAALQGAC